MGREQGRRGRTAISESTMRYGAVLAGIKGRWAARRESARACRLADGLEKLERVTTAPTDSSCASRGAGTLAGVGAGSGGGRTPRRLDSCALTDGVWPHPPETVAVKRTPPEGPADGPSTETYDTFTPKRPAQRRSAAKAVDCQRTTFRATASGQPCPQAATVTESDSTEMVGR